MLVLLWSGAHLQATKASRAVGRCGKFISYETSDTVPASWEDVRRIWDQHGRVVQGEPKPGDLVGKHYFSGELKTATSSERETITTAASAQ